MVYFIEWLNDNSGAMAGMSGIITAVATIVLAILTGIYVHLTRQILKSMSVPEIVVGIRWDQEKKNENGSHDYSVRICVRNVGQRIARNVRFDFDSSFSPFGDFGIAFKNIEILESGIPALEPGHEKCQIAASGNIINLLLISSKEKEKCQTTIIVTYENSKGEEYSHDYPLDFGDVIDTTLIR